MQWIKTAMSAVGRALSGAPVVLLLLGGGAACSLGAWSVQASAAADLAEATAVQTREVAETDVSPPSPEDNRAIIGVLDQSIAVRREIDGQLERIEASVRALAGRQTEAGTVTKVALDEVGLIARALGGAEQAAGSSVAKLGELGRKLRASARIARLIEKELAELDRKMGPPAGRP